MRLPIRDIGWLFEKRSAVANKQKPKAVRGAIATHCIFMSCMEKDGKNIHRIREQTPIPKVRRLVIFVNQLMEDNVLDKELIESKAESLRINFLELTLINSNNHIPFSNST